MQNDNEKLPSSPGSFPLKTSYLSSNKLQNNASNISIVSADYPQDLLEASPPGTTGSQETISDSFSRPLSRSSTNSNISTTANKDGVEGKRMHRLGPSQYSNSLMYNLFMANNPTASMTTNALGTSTGDKLNTANIELHNSIFKRQVTPSSAPKDEDISLNNYSEFSAKTTNAEIDGETEGKFLHSTDAEISLKDKIRLMDKGVME